MMTQLLTVSEIVDAVGGRSAAAELGGVNGNAVSNWKARGRIPAELFMVFAGALERAGKEASPDVFGFAPIGAEP